MPDTTTAPPAPARRPLGARDLATAALVPGRGRQTGTPPLDPDRWTARHRIFVVVAVTVAAAAGLVEAVQATAHSGAAGTPLSTAEGVRAFLAVLLAFGVAGLALSLRGITLPGVLAGGFFVTAGIVSWTWTGAASRLVWVVLAVEGAVFLAWTHPWTDALRRLRDLPRLGTAWLGLAYWLLGGVAGVLVLHLGVAVGRFAYLALFALGALAVVLAGRRTGRDLTVGIVAAFLLALAALLLVGSGNALDDVHAVRADVWGQHMQGRFWGGPGLLYHPNSIAVIAVVAAIRIGADPAFARWQRYAAPGLAALLLILVNSRTGLLYLGVAAVLHALLVLARRLRYPGGRLAGPAAVVLPGVLVVMVALASGGTGFLTASRYGGDDVTSGRSTTWSEVWTEFKADTVAEQIFGDAKNVRGYVIRADAAAPGTTLPQLTTDNAAVGALRRGGVAGVLAFVLGLGLMVWHALRRGTPPWFTIAAVGSLSTIATSDWLLGNTGGTLWILLLAGESYLLFPSRPAGVGAASADAVDAETAG